MPNLDWHRWQSWMRSQTRSVFAEISGLAISCPFPPGWEHFTLTYGFHRLKITDAGGRLGSHSFYLGRRVLRESSRPPEVPSSPHSRISFHLYVERGDAKSTRLRIFFVPCLGVGKI